MAEKIEKRSVSVRIDGKEIENSYKAIMKEVSALRFENQKLAEDTEGYVRKALALAQASEAAQKNRDSVKAIAEAWKAMPEDVRQSVIDQQAALLKLREDFGKLMEGGESTRSPQMKALKAQMLELQNSIVETTQKYVEMQKPVSNSIAAIKKELTLLEKEIETVAQDSDTYRQKMARWQELNTIVEAHKNTLKGIEPAVKGSLEALQADIKEVEDALSKSILKSKEYYQNIEKLNKLNAQLDEHKKSIGQVEDAWYKNIPALKEFAAVAVGAFAIDKITEYGKALITNATVMETNLAKASSVLGDSLGKINNEAEKHANTFGVARSQYVGAAADMSAFFQSQFASREEGAKLSAEAVRLAGVLAGFKGGGGEAFTEALEAIKGGFSDNVEELAKFNIALSDDIIKSAMAEKGLDKLNAKQQEHGKGLVLLQLIQEKATAQMQAFGDMSDTSARKQAELSAILKEIGDSLSRLLIPVLSSALSVIKPVLEGVEKLADKIGDLGNPVRAASDAFFEQKAKVKDLETSINPLISQYEHLTSKSKLNKTEQNQLKEAIQKMGEAVPLAVTGIDDYGRALNVNIGAVKSFLVEQKKLTEYLNKDAIALEEQHKKVIEQKYNIAKKFEEDISSGRISGEKKFLFTVNYQNDPKAKETALDSYRKEIENLKTELDGIDLNLKRLKGDNVKQPEAPKPNLSGESEDERNKRKQREDEEKKHLDNLKEILLKHQADVSSLQQRDDERDAERIREKYRKNIEDAKALEKSKQTEVAQEAQKVRIDLEKTLEKELEAKQIENTEKRVAKLKEIETAAIAAVKTLKAEGLDTELAAIAAKYDAKIAEIKKIALDDPKAQGQSQAAIDAVEAERQNAVIDTKNKFNDKLLEQVKAFQNEVFQLHADDEEKELARLEVQYNELILKAQKYHEGEMEVMKWYEEQKTKIKEDAEKKRTSATESQIKKQAEIEKKLADGQIQIAESKLQTMKNFADIVGSLLGETAKKSTAFVVLTKAIAAAELFFQSQREIAGYYAAYAAIPGGAAIATGLAVQAKIRAAFGMAAILAQAIPQVTQKNDGGPVEVVGKSDGKTYRPRYRGNAETGMYYEPSLFLAAENKPEYVIAYPEMQNPIIANFLPVIEGIRQRRVVRGYDDGGITAEGGGVALKATQNTITQNTVSMPYEMFQSFMEVMNNVNAALERGIIMTYEDVEHIDKMRNSIKNARGY